MLLVDYLLCPQPLVLVDFPIKSMRSVSKLRETGAQDGQEINEYPLRQAFRVLTLQGCQQGSIGMWL